MMRDSPAHLRVLVSTVTAPKVFNSRASMVRRHDPGARMGDALEVPDSTDWLNTPLAGLVPVEAALRCQVCKDFFTTPMITSCSHSFCSICIRRCLAVDGKCPTCRAPEQEIRLRRNWAVEEVVDSFQASRQANLEWARRPAAVVTNGIHSSKRKAGVAELDEGDTPALKQARKTRSQSRRAGQSPASAVEDVTIVDDDEEEYAPGRCMIGTGALADF